MLLLLAYRLHWDSLALPLLKKHPQMALYLKEMEHFSLLQKNSPKKELYRTQFLSMISLATTVDIKKKTTEQFFWWRSTNRPGLASGPPSHCKWEREGAGCTAGRVAALGVQPSSYTVINGLVGWTSPLPYSHLPVPPQRVMESTKL